MRGCYGKVHPPEVRAAAREMWEAGLHMDEICERLACSPASVRNWQRTAGGWDRHLRSAAKARRKPWRNAARAFYEAGFTFGWIAAHIGMSETGLAAFARRDGWLKDLHDQNRAHDAARRDAHPLGPREKLIRRHGREAGEHRWERWRSVGMMPQPGPVPSARRRARHVVRPGIARLIRVERKLRELAAGRRCSACHKHRPPNEFYRTKKGWLASRCSACEKAHSVRTYAANIEREKLRVRRYKHSNPDKVAKWGQDRWKRIASSSDGTVTPEAFDTLTKRASSCYWCGRRLRRMSDRTIDHVIPTTDRERFVHGTSNLCVACPSCNSSKGDRLPDEWSATPQLHLPC